MIKPSCEKCRFWEPVTTNAKPVPFGRCRRYAPRQMMEHRDTDWPITDYDDWCGEFYCITIVEQEK